MPSISVPAALAIGTVASGVVGAGASIYGANKAASSADKAANLQQQQYGQTRADLSPYFAPGQEAVTNALSLAQSGPTDGGPDYTSLAYANLPGNITQEQLEATDGGPDYTSLAYANLPGNMTQEQLEATDGYQFTRDQGLKSVQSATAARGLGISGAALKGAAEYATGLANKTYLDQFNIRQKQFDDYINLNTGQQTNLQNQFGRLNSIATLRANVAQQRFGDYLNLNTGQQTNLQNQYSRLSGIATLGANAAAGLGTQGTSAASTAGNYLNQGGLGQAAGAQGANSALTGGVNNYLAYDAYNRRTATNASQPGTTGYTQNNNAVGDDRFYQE
jgi:hypothetical protein